LKNGEILGGETDNQARISFMYQKDIKQKGNNEDEFLGLLYKR
jgi:hypothetical protein